MTGSAGTPPRRAGSGQTPRSYPRRAADPPGWPEGRLNSNSWYCSSRRSSRRTVLIHPVEQPIPGGIPTRQTAIDQAHILTVVSEILPGSRRIRSRMTTGLTLHQPAEVLPVRKRAFRRRRNRLMDRHINQLARVTRSSASTAPPASPTPHIRCSPQCCARPQDESAADA